MVAALDEPRRKSWLLTRLYARIVEFEFDRRYPRGAGPASQLSHLLQLLSTTTHAKLSINGGD